MGKEESHSRLEPISRDQVDRFQELSFVLILNNPVKIQSPIPYKPTVATASIASVFDVPINR